MFLALPAVLILANVSSSSTLPEPFVAGLEVPASTPPIGPVAPLPAAPQARVGYKLSYTFIEVGYFSTHIDSVDESTDGYRARAQLGLFDVLYVFAGYAREDLDFSGGDADSDSFELGAGAHLPLTSRLDVVGEASWIYDDLDSDTLSDLDGSNNGWTIFLGGRGLLFATDHGGLELNGGFRWQDREALLSDDQVGAWEAGARFHFLDHLSVGLKYEFLEDDGRWGVDGRFSF